MWVRWRLGLRASKSSRTPGSASGMYTSASGYVNATRSRWAFVVDGESGEGVDWVGQTKGKLAAATAQECDRSYTGPERLGQDL